MKYNLSITKYKKKWNTMSLAAKASIALIIVKFIQKGITMITGPIFTRIMPIDEYGIVSTFTSWQSVLYIITTLNMAQGVFNNGMLDFKKDRDTFCFSILCLANICTLFWIIIYVAFRKVLGPIIGIPWYLIVLMFLYFFVTPAYNYWMGKQRFEFKYKAMTTLMIGTTIVSNLLAIILVVVSPNELKSTAKLTATEGISVAIGLFFYIYLIYKTKAKVKISYWKYALKFNIPLIPHYLSMYVLSSSDRIIISKLVNNSATAIYNVSYTVASVMLIFWNSIEASYAPWIYQKLEKKNEDAVKKRANQILLIFALFTLLSSLFAPEIIRILAPLEYYSGIYIIPSVAAGVYFTAVYSIYMRVELYSKKTKLTMVASLIGACLNLILNYIFIPIYGMYAAGYTTLISYIVMAIAHGFYLRKIGYSYVYDNKIIFAISTGVLVCSIIVSFAYKYNVVRYIIIAILILFAIKNRKDIIKILKSKK